MASQVKTGRQRQTPAADLMRQVSKSLAASRLRRRCSAAIARPSVCGLPRLVSPACQQIQVLAVGNRRRGARQKNQGQTVG